MVRFTYGSAHDGGASLEIGVCRRIILGLTADHYTASQYVKHLHRCAEVKYPFRGYLYYAYIANIDMLAKLGHL